MTAPGGRYELEITSVGGSAFTASCTLLPGNKAENQQQSSDKPRIILLQCLPKGKKLELIVRQAVEAGAAMIIPVESAHSVARIADDRSSKKAERLRKIAEEAAQAEWESRCTRGFSTHTNERTAREIIR